MRSLAIFAFVIAAISCKSTNSPSASLKDIAAIHGDKVILFYIDDSTASVVRAECPEIDGDKSRVSGYDMRGYCKDNREDIPLMQFQKKLYELYVASAHKEKMSETEKQIFTYTLGKLSRGPRRQDAPQGLDKAANAIDVGKGEILDPFVKFSDPVNLQIYIKMVSLLEDVFKPKAHVPKRLPLPAEPIEMTPLPKMEAPIVDTGVDLGANFFLTGRLQGDSNQSYNGVEITLQEVNQKPCSAAIYRVKVRELGSDEDIELYRAPEGDDRFFMTDLKKRIIGSVDIGMLNYSNERIKCKIKIRGLTYVMEKLSLDWDEVPVQWENRDEVMRRLMGDPHHRMNHYIWHSARNIWNLATTTQRDRNTMRKYGFAPPRPLVYRAGRLDRKASAATGAGEDFLYMHRVMLNVLRAKLGSYMYKPWIALPNPDSKEFPVWVEARVKPKSLEGYKQMLGWQRKYTDQTYLRSVKTLSELGINIEFDIHNSMHMRFARPADEARRFDMDPLTSRGGVGWVYDSVRYDHLADSYSAHVNPTFWRIHGWVDQRIDDWLRVHGYSSISKDCQGRNGCYQWRGTWLGVKAWIHHGVPESGVHQAGHHTHKVEDFSEFPKDLAQRLSRASFMFLGEDKAPE